MTTYINLNEIEYDLKKIIKYKIWEILIIIVTNKCLHNIMLNHSSMSSPLNQVS